MKGEDIVWTEGWEVKDKRAKKESEKASNVARNEERSNEKTIRMRGSLG